jgi:hypothetical protein
LNPKPNFEALESGFMAGHEGFKQILRRRRWRPAEASGGSNVCEKNNLVFCLHIFFLQFFFQ